MGYSPRDRKEWNATEVSEHTGPSCVMLVEVIYLL